MIIKDIYPAKAQFLRNEPVELKVELDRTQFRDGLTLRCVIRHLDNPVFEAETPLKSTMSDYTIAFSLDRPVSPICGYRAAVYLLAGESILETAATAFDQADSWKDAPRYGFLSEFGEQDMADASDIAQMNKYHINIVQFYDWMYRHYRFFPPETQFSDPFGRKLSLDTIKKKIDLAHQYGMKAFAYGAVYGAQKEYFNDHPGLALYQNDGEPSNLGDFLINMDISRESGWHDHIIREFSKSIFWGFDGIHMDQYGQPKEAWSTAGGSKKIRKLKTDFYNLINDTKQWIRDEGREPGLIFNAVNNWPTDAVANSEEDAVYIEVWPPNDTYNDLYDLICDAKKCCKDKQVILAAYLAPFMDGKHTKIDYAQNATLLTMAAIFASGGFHLLLGENNGILQEGYYVHYAHAADPTFCARLKNYADFMTAYEELLFGYDICDDTMTYTGGINNEYRFTASRCDGAEHPVAFLPKAKEDCVWTLVKEKPGFKIIHLLNYLGLDNINWNEEKPSLPDAIGRIEITALVLEDVKAVYWASPDVDDCESVKLDYTYVEHPVGKAIRFVVPTLNVWDMVYIQTE